MSNDIWNIIINVISSFIFALLVWLWKRRQGKPLNTLQPIPQPRPVELEPSDHRARNRAAFNEAAQNFMFYLVTFAAIYFSITMPALFKAAFSKDPILLSQAYHIGDYLPGIPVGKSGLQLAFFIAAAAIYLPVLYLAELLTSLVAGVFDHFTTVTQRLWDAITMMIIFLSCIPLAGASIWLFYEKSYGDSVMTAVMFTLLGIVFALSQSGRK